MGSVKVGINIPDGMEFSDLKLSRDTATGNVSFDIAAIERIEKASGLKPGTFMRNPEDALSSLIVTWYMLHIESGGKPDPVAEDLMAEVRAEDSAGQQFSYQPGRA